MDAIRNGKKLRELRGCRTAKEVAESLGISESALLMYERGERNPRDEAKKILANYYGVGILDLFYPDDYTNREETHPPTRAEVARDEAL